MSKEVRIEAYDKRYKGGHTMPLIPYFDYSIDNYVTGQERVPGRKHGLSKEQIEGSVKVTDEQRSKFPFLITFNENFRGILIRKGMTLRLDKDNDGNFLYPREAAVYDFLIFGQKDVVADSKSKAVPGRHAFYFVDKVADAKDRVASKREFFKASKLVDTNLTEESFYELLLYVNYQANETYIPNNSEPSLVEDAVYDACEKYTDVVIKFFEKEAQDEVFVLKLVKHGIIHFRDGAFSDNKDQYLGSTPSEVNAFLSKKGNNLKGVHWRKALAKVDKRFAEGLKKKDDSEEGDKE